MLFQIPLRNLTRNSRRTLLCISIIALGTMMSYAIIGYVDYSLEMIREGTVRQYGNFQIASERYWKGEKEEFQYLLQPERVERIYETLRADQDVIAFTPQLLLSGLAYIGAKTKILGILAVEPANGALDYNDLVLEGRGLLPDDGGAALIGKSFADELKLSPGDRFIVTASTTTGQYNSLPLTVAGVFGLNNAQAESQVVFVPLEYAKRLLNTAGVTKIAVKTANLAVTDVAAREVQTRLSASDQDLEVQTWVELSDFYRQIVSFFNTLFGFVTSAVFILVFFMILQVLTLAFLERTREIGTLRAIGTKRGEIFRMFLIESVWLGLLGSALGIAAGQVLGIGFNNLGLGWTPPGAVENVPVKLSLTAANAFVPFVATTLATIGSSLYPSAYSARTSIVNALRTR